MRHRGFILFAVASLAALAGAAAQQQPAASFRNDATWWAPADGKPFPRELDYANAAGVVRTLLKDGPAETLGHAFFSPLGPNGRACITCHQPADAMALSVESVRNRWATQGSADPLFAAVDGSNCPTLRQDERTSHSLLLDHGLIRIERDWPIRDAAGRGVTADFRLEVVRDPYGCNSGEWGPGGKKAKVSVYRRPRPTTNLKYLTAIGFAYDPKDGMPLEIDPETGKPASGNLTADRRVLSLEAQARDAMRTHLGVEGLIGPSIVRQLVDFEMRLSSAQAVDNRAGRLDDGVLGGPGHLEASQPGQLGSIGRAVWSEFEGWEKLPAGARLTPEQRAFRESVARGARVFREKTFLITDSAGINSPIGFGNPVRNSCVFCHNMSQMGNDVAPGQVDLGTTNQPFADPAPHLPLFRITCLAEPHPHYGKVIYTSDPGYALTTGKCADVGKITLQSMRGLAARAPYFSNGSARTLRDVIDFYERRYRIGYTEQEKQDLVNLMSVL
ncbi:MAG TPA: hypothetical protein VIA80_15990 [Hyphomonadaceae bacterium]